MNDDLEKAYTDLESFIFKKREEGEGEVNKFAAADREKASASVQD